MSDTSIPIYVVSLTRDKERRALMEAHFAERNMAFEFLDASDAGSVSAEQLEEYCQPTGPWGLLRPHDMACGASHLRAMEKFLAGKAEHCLICEDDIFISEDTSLWLSDLSWWPGGADVVKLERWRNDGMLIVMARGKDTYRGRKLRRLVSRHPGCAGYILTRHAAKEILAACPINVPIDHLFFNPSVSPLSRSLKVFQVQPGLIRQGNEPDPVSKPESSSPPIANTGFEREKGLAWVWRELRRGWYEVSRWPAIIWALIRGGSIEKPKWE